MCQSRSDITEGTALEHVLSLEQTVSEWNGFLEGMNAIVRAREGFGTYLPVLGSIGGLGVSGR
jgi:hypothetical protein